MYNERRAAEAAAYLLYRAGGTLPVLKLMKLLYLAERLSLQRHGEPLTGDRLVSMPHGPVLSITYTLIGGGIKSCKGGWDSWVSDRTGHNLTLRKSKSVYSDDKHIFGYGQKVGIPVVRSFDLELDPDDRQLGLGFETPLIQQADENQ